MVTVPKKNVTFVPTSEAKPIGKRRETARTDKQRLEMVRDVLDAHAVGDPDALLHERVTALVNDRDCQREKVLTRIIENAALRAQLRHEEREAAPIRVEGIDGYRLL